MAKRDDDPPGSGKPDRADLALERPRREIARRDIEPIERAVQDIDEVETVRPLVVDRALADPALQIGEAGEVERHAGPAAGEKQSASRVSHQAAVRRAGSIVFSAASFSRGSRCMLPSFMIIVK